MVGIAVFEHNRADIVEFTVKFAVGANYQSTMDQTKY